MISGVKPDTSLEDLLSWQEVEDDIVSIDDGYWLVKRANLATTILTSVAFEKRATITWPLATKLMTQHGRAELYRSALADRGRSWKMPLPQLKLEGIFDAVAIAQKFTLSFLFPFFFGRPPARLDDLTESCRRIELHRATRFEIGPETGRMREPVVADPALDTDLYAARQRFRDCVCDSFPELARMETEAIDAVEGIIHSLLLTVGNALAWTICEIARRPEWVDHLRKQYRPRAAIRSFILEILRFYPPAWMLGRQAVKDTMVADTLIKKGEITTACILLAHRHPRDWRDPHRFMVERFVGRSAGANWMPFGAGSRACPAAHIGLWMLIETALYIVRHFEIHLENAFPQPLLLIGLQPEMPATVRFVGR